MRLGTGIQNCLRSTREIEVWPWWSSPESAEPPLEACDEEGGQVSKGLADLTGGHGYSVDLRGEEGRAQVADGGLWAKLRRLRPRLAPPPKPG